MKSFTQPGPKFNLYGVYHHHEYGGSTYLLWSDHDPSEQEVIVACGMDFEPDKDEWISVDPIGDAEIPTVPTKP